MAPVMGSLQQTDWHIWVSRWKEIRTAFKDSLHEFRCILDNCVKPIGRSASDYLHKLIDYNMSDGKLIRGTLVAAVVEACTSDGRNEKLYAQAHMTGWCIEMIHAGFLILDDIMDNSHFRRGRPSWFKFQLDAGLGLLSVNDGLHLVMTAKHMLSKVFKAEGCDQQTFIKVAQIFDEVGYQTCWGQNLDTGYSLRRNSGNNDLDLRLLTRDNFNTIAQWKTGYYTFHLPVACGMAIAGITDANVLTETKSILLQLGQYFQAQDDYLDCFGDPNVTGKVGTDIADGKCTWLIAECLARASPEQIDLIKQHYGREDQSSVGLIQELYSSLDLARHFRFYEMELHRALLKDIVNLRNSLSTESRLPGLLGFLTNLLFERSH